MKKSFTITPIRPIDELLIQSRNELPPTEDGTFLDSHLVDVFDLEPTFHLDVRYACHNNFVGTPLYAEPKVMLQKPAADALIRVHRSLAKRGYGLILYDGYRPWYVTWVFWQATPDAQKIFVADPNEGSKHNRGCAIDVGMYELQTNKAVEFPSGFDEMTHRAYSDYSGGTLEQTMHRKILRDAMQEEGFTVHPKEWWHFDYKDWPHYPITNTTI
ncbi:MAG: M15 family metallopeptidase [Chlamydiales bacterium]|nr:M15 family metallopeptidase [Chlamydiales bacterium]